MKKNIFLIFVIALLFCSSSFTSVNADIGPKPAIEVTIIGVNEEYYFDLLIYKSTELTIIETEPWSYYLDEYPEVLTDFQDEEGFVSYELYRTPAVVRQTESNIYLINYHAPDSFKIVIVMKDNNAIIVSEYIVTNSFESKVTWDLSGIDLESDLSEAGTVSGNIQDENITTHNWFITGFNTLIRVILTAILELSVLWLFGFRKKSTFIKVGIVNAVTQTLLSILLISMYLQGGIWNYIFLTVIGEFIVFIVEIIAYFSLIDEKRYLRIFLYTLTANLVTIIAGFFLISII